MNNWEWQSADDSKTNVILHSNGKKYYISKMKFGQSYRVDINEDHVSVAGENTFNETFKKEVGQEQSVDEQIIEWASKQLEIGIKICDKCSELKFCKDLTEGAKNRDEFKKYTVLCSKCRKDIWDIISEKSNEERRKESQEIIKQLSKNPPNIIGNFKKRIEAYRVLMESPNPDREDMEDGFVFCKGIIQTNDGYYYPVFLVVESPGGEHWDTCFISQNHSEVISQSHIFPFIDKAKDDVFPYQYESLCHIEDDFHQQTRFGNISQRSVRHQFTNKIKFDRPDKWDELEDAIHIEVRSYFSIQHLLSAANFYKHLVVLENKNFDDLSDDEIIHHRSLTVSIILSCVCFLESTINELFMDAAEGTDGILRDMSKANIKMLSKMWKRGIPRTANYNIVEKYQVALTLTKKKEINLGLEFAQNVSYLIKLRNALIHFEPETVITKSEKEPESVKIQKLEKHLKGKFDLNKFTGENNLFFPDKCLSVGCAEWAINSALYFTDLFFDTLELIPPYQKIRYKVETYLNTVTNTM